MTTQNQTMAKLYIDKNAPPELKENIRLSQKLLDNMQTYKEKADNGTLTLDDLKQMTRQNDQVVAQFPKGDRTKVGLPAKLDSMEDIKALAKMRLAEAQAKAGSNTGLKINSLQELQTICQMPPESIATLVLNDAKQKKAERKGKQAKKQSVSEKKVDQKIPTVKKPKDANLFDHLLDSIDGLLNTCKHAYHDLDGEWPLIKALEESLIIHVHEMCEYGQPAVDYLESYLLGEIEDDDMEEKKTTAAFILSCYPDINVLDHLPGLFKENKEVKQHTTTALKYGLNKELDDQLDKRLYSYPTELQTGIIEILDYRKKIDTERWEVLFQQSEQPVQSKILRSFTTSGIDVEYALLEPLLEDPETRFYEETILTAMMAGYIDALYKMRRRFIDRAENMVNLPMYLACAGEYDDFNYIKSGLSQKKSKEATIKALGIQGITPAIPLLLDELKKGGLDLAIQKRVVESLELITGADLSLPFPEIKEGPKDKEYEVTVETGWFPIWLRWWKDNEHNFVPKIRYRRGQFFTLKECLKEMAFPKGNHWSRQFSYYELIIRSGQRITQFEADWWARDQLEAIQKWQEWWGKSKDQFGDDQWLFYGRISQ